MAFKYSGGIPFCHCVINWETVYQGQPMAVYTWASANVHDRLRAAISPFAMMAGFGQWNQPQWWRKMSWASKYNWTMFINKVVKKHMAAAALHSNHLFPSNVNQRPATCSDVANLLRTVNQSELQKIWKILHFYITKVWKKTCLLMKLQGVVIDDKFLVHFQAYFCNSELMFREKVVPHRGDVANRADMKRNIMYLCITF